MPRDDLDPPEMLLLAARAEAATGSSAYSCHTRGQVTVAAASHAGFAVHVTAGVQVQTPEDTPPPTDPCVRTRRPFLQFGSEHQR